MERHPHLKEKLQLLYALQLNPRITSNTDLANEIGKSRQAISRWCVGSETTRGNSIPLSIVSKVARSFKIEPAWLALPFVEFEELVQNHFDQIDSANSERKTKISTSTLPITSVSLFGRDVELNLLNELWYDDNINVMQMVAFGGSGKTSLVNKWLSDLNSNNYRGAEFVYAWSFYWNASSTDVSTSGDYFIENALEWFGDPNPSQGTPWSKATRLAALIRSAKTILILDGLEPLQNPAGEKYGHIIDSSLSLLIKELAVENTGLCLITTRYPVADLMAFMDGRVYSLQLSRMSQEAGIAYLLSAGIKGSLAELIEVVEKYSGHALSLSLLAGYISTVCNGELSGVNDLGSALEENQGTGRVDKLLHDSLQWLENKPELKLLWLMAIFDRTTTISELRRITSFSMIEGLTKGLNNIDLPKWKYAVSDLADMNLITTISENGEVHIDCHPLVKQWVNKHLRSEKSKIWRSGNELVFRYISSNASIKPSSTIEYESLFKAVSHAARAECYLEAFQIYYSRIKKAQFSLFAKGSINSERDCIKQFFNEEWDLKDMALPEESNLFLQMSAATNLVHLGETKIAMQLFKQCTKWFRKNAKWLELSIASAQILSMMIICGELQAAKTLLKEMRDVVERANNSVVSAGEANFEGYIAFLEGDIQKAKSKFAQSESTLIKCIPDSPVSFPTVSIYYCRFLLETDSKESALERCLKSVAWRQSNSWQAKYDSTALLAGDMLVLGLVFLEFGDKNNAKTQLFKQVDILRSSNEWLYLPAGLNSRARYHFKVKNFQESVNDLNESIDVSKRTGAKFGEWEAHLDMAQVYLAMNDKDLSSKSLERAKQMSNMDQYKFRDHEIAELESKLAMH